MNYGMETKQKKYLFFKCSLNHSETNAIMLFIYLINIPLAVTYLDVIHCLQFESILIIFRPCSGISEISVLSHTCEELI